MRQQFLFSISLSLSLSLSLLDRGTRPGGTGAQPHNLSPLLCLLHSVAPSSFLADSHRQREREYLQSIDEGRQFADEIDEEVEGRARGNLADKHFTGEEQI